MCGGGVGRSGKLSFRIRFGGGPRRGSPHRQNTKIDWKWAVLGGFWSRRDIASVRGWWKIFCKIAFAKKQAPRENPHLTESLNVKQNLSAFLMKIDLDPSITKVAVRTVFLRYWQKQVKLRAPLCIRRSWFCLYDARSKPQSEAVHSQFSKYASRQHQQTKHRDIHWLFLFFR